MRTPTFSAENSIFSRAETCALVQEALLLAHAITNANRFVFPGGKLNFAAVFSSFCKSTSFYPADLNFILEYILNIVEVFFFPGEFKRY